MSELDCFGGGDVESDAAQVPVPVPVPDPELEFIRSVQAQHAVAVDAVIDLYRTLHKTNRLQIKIKLERLYEDLKVLGERYGVPRNQYPPIDNG